MNDILQIVYDENLPDVPTLTVFRKEWPNDIRVVNTIFRENAENLYCTLLKGGHDKVPVGEVKMNAQETKRRVLPMIKEVEDGNVD